MKVHALGIDLAKNIFQLHGARCVLTRRVRRDNLMKLEPDADKPRSDQAVKSRPFATEIRFSQKRCTSLQNP